MYGIRFYMFPQVLPSRTGISMCRSPSDQVSGQLAAVRSYPWMVCSPLSGSVGQLPCDVSGLYGTVTANDQLKGWTVTHHESSLGKLGLL